MTKSKEPFIITCQHRIPAQGMIPTTPRAVPNELFFTKWISLRCRYARCMPLEGTACVCVCGCVCVCVCVRVYVCVCVYV